ncbi:unnamed protein product [Knipowitschia caucasica]
MVVPVDMETLLREQGGLLGGAPAAGGEEGLCVVGVFGKSGLQPGSLKESLMDTLLDRHVFPTFASSLPGAGGCGLQVLHEPERRVLYVLMSSACDSRELLRTCAAMSSGSAHTDAHELWKSLEREHCLHLLYMFSVCHVMLLVHPNHTFDVTYDRLFRAVDALRQKVLPLLRAAIKDCPVSKEWKLNCRPCPPRLLFVFHMNGTLKVSTGPDTGANPEKPKKHSPRRRLQHALEDQIYRIFRKSRVLTNQSSNCVFTVPVNQAFVYVVPGPEEDPVGSVLGQLQAQCALGEQQSVLGPKRYHLMRRSTMAPTPPEVGSGPFSGAPQDCSLKEFLWQHIELVLSKKGFDDSVGRNPQPSHLELPSFSKWLQVASRLHQVMLGPLEDEHKELLLKVQNQLKVLEGFLDADAKFSDSRCQKALPLAHSAYQSNLPHNYTSTVHKNQLAQALRVYSQHARGVAFQRYALQLHDDCYKFWSSGHQLCEERSLSDQHCVHKFHLLPQPGEKPDLDHNPPILQHNSRGRSTSSCNCGRKQATREDPFDLQAANYDFYKALEEKCCGKLEHLDFPVFESSTADPAPASEPEQQGPAEGTGPEDKSHTPGEAQSLSLALSLGHSTDSLEHFGEGDSTEAPRHKRPSLLDRQPSTVEYLAGMMHSGCPKGLLPKFSSWSLLKLGPSKLYNCHVGLEQPSFLPGSSFLLPWDLVIRSRSEEEGLSQSLDSSGLWPVPNKSVSGKRGGPGGPGRSRRRDDVARLYVGFCYEDSRGRRFISSGPDKILKVLGPGGAKEPASRVLSTDMPLYMPSPSQGRGLKLHLAQLSHLYILVPDAPLEVTLSPQVQPGPPPCPLFHPEQPEVVLPPDGLWVLRFPFAFATERGPCFPPKDGQPLSDYRLLRGVLRACPVPPPHP